MPLATAIGVACCNGVERLPTASATGVVALVLLLA